MNKNSKGSSNLTIIINYKSIIALVTVIGLALLFYLIQNVLILIFLGLIMALALEPFVEYLRGKRVPHGLAVFLVVILCIGLLGILASLALTPLIQQIRLLSINFPYYLESVLNIPGIDKYTDTLWGQISSGSGRIFTFTLGAFSGIVSALIVVVFTVYILLDFNNLRQHLLNIFPPAHRKDLGTTIATIEIKLKDWLRGQVTLMLIIGVISYIGLMVLGLRDYALALAVIAGLLEAVPVIGPTLSVVPAAIIGFTFSTPTGIAVIVLYIIIQQLENNLIVPKVMQRAVGFNPLVTIVAFMVGSQLMGLIGAILSLPVLIIITEVWKYIHADYILKKNPKE